MTQASATSLQNQLCPQQKPFCDLRHSYRRYKWKDLIGRNAPCDLPTLRRALEQGTLPERANTNFLGWVFQRVQHKPLTLRWPVGWAYTMSLPDYRCIMGSRMQSSGSGELNSRRSRTIAHCCFLTIKTPLRPEMTLLIRMFSAKHSNADVTITTGDWCVTDYT